MRILLAALAALLALAGNASAHSASTAYLRIDAREVALDVRWSIALRDLDYAVGLDTDGDGAITWGELRARAPAVEAYALARLRLDADREACAPGPVTLQADQLGDGGYAVLSFAAMCPHPASAIGVHYALLFDLDPQHRGLLNVIADGAPHAQVLSPGQPDARVEAAPGYGETIQRFFAAGVEHLLTGADHMMFVVMLLLPAVFRREGRILQPVPSLSGALVETAKVLSLFTIAHGTTLTLSVLHVLSIPQRISEPAIAVTILLTALDNVRPFLPGRRWMLAFAFGLIHGLGFANALGPLDLSAGPLAAALLSFNLGLDAAQIGIALLVLPLAFLARGTALYAGRVMPGVSAAVAVTALAWFADRVGDFGMMPF